MMTTKQEHAQHIAASRAYLDRAREAMDEGQWKEADALMTCAVDRLRAAERVRVATEQRNGVASLYALAAATAVSAK